MSNGQANLAHGFGLLRRERVHLIENANGLEHNAADNLETAQVELVNRIFRGVPVGEVVAVGEVNEVHGGNTSFHKRNVIVEDLQFAAEKMGLISQTLGRLINNFLQPSSGIRFAFDVQVCVADHIGQDERFHFL